VIPSEQVLAWVAEGEGKGRTETLLEILDLKFGPVPPEVASVIRATTDLFRLKRWVAAAVTAPTLDVFRQSTQLGGTTGCQAAGKGTTAQPTVSRAQFAHAG